MAQTVTVNGLRLTFPDYLDINITANGVELRQKSTVKAPTVEYEPIVARDVNKNTRRPPASYRTIENLNQALVHYKLQPYETYKERILKALQDQFSGISGARMITNAVFTHRERKAIGGRPLPRYILEHMVEEGYLQTGKRGGGAHAVYALVINQPTEINDTPHKDVTHERHERP